LEIVRSSCWIARAFARWAGGRDLSIKQAVLATIKFVSADAAAVKAAFNTLYLAVLRLALVEPCRNYSLIITRSPLRISLGGGGTDLPSYYRKHGGFVLAAAINQYVYITINEAFRPRIILKYSKLEDVERVEDIQHPIIREALRLTGVTGPYLEIVSLSDIPAGTGLGSSGSFTTALLRALHTVKRRSFVPPQELAEQACHIEIDLLKEPVGKQDQYISAFRRHYLFRIFAGRPRAWPSL
jgi:D-glycero-alpha-D-manno-heptose-7-phosphate kinase